MSSLEELLQRSKNPGKMVERKTFTLSRAKAIEKQREYALRSPQQYILELIQAAVLSGATYIAIDIALETMLVAFIGGKPIKATELENIFDYLFADRSNPETRHLVQLALGLNALLQRKPAAIRVESGDGRKAVRMDLDKKGNGTVGVPEDAIAGTYLLMEKAGSWFDRFRNIQVYPEQALIEDRCSHCPVPIILNGTAPFGYTARRNISLFGIKNQHAFDLGERRGVVALPERSSQRGFQVIMGGTRITTMELPELGTIEMLDRKGKPVEMPLFGVIYDDGLRKTADQSDIVQDERFASMLRAIQPETTQLIEKVTGRAYTPPLLPQSETGEDELAPLPQDIPVIGPQGTVRQEQILDEASRSPMFWITKEDRPGLEQLADPARFPFRVLVMRETQALTLRALSPDCQIQKLGTAADVEFVRRVLDRGREIHEVNIHVGAKATRPAGILHLRLHLRGPRPPWGGDTVPALVGHTRSIWQGALPLELPHLSVSLELERALPLGQLGDVVGDLSQLVDEHAWRLLEGLDANTAAGRRFTALLLGRAARPHFVDDEGVTRLTFGLPSTWRLGKTAGALHVAQTEEGPLTLDAFIALQGTAQWERLAGGEDPDALQRLEQHFGYGHLVGGGVQPILALGWTGARWERVEEGRHSGSYRRVVWLKSDMGPAPAPEPGWIEVSTPSPLIAAATQEDDAASEWAPAWEHLYEELSQSDWSASVGDRGARASAVGALARLHLARHLGVAEQAALLAPSDGSPAVSLDALVANPAFQVTARHGVRVSSANVVALTLDELMSLQSSARLSLRYDDPPEVWDSLRDDAGWLLRQEVDIPGVRGWLGLRLPFDETGGILLHAADEVHALPELDRQMACHGSLFLESDLSLSRSQRDLLGLAGLQLYQNLVAILRQSGDAARREAARKYGIRFAWLCWEQGRRQLGTLWELAQTIRVDAPDGTRWTLEQWLRSPDRPDPGVPMPLSSSGDSALALRPAATAKSLTDRINAMLKSAGVGWEVLIATKHERFGRALTVEAHPGARLFQITANRGSEVVALALDEAGRTRELMLLDIARRIVDQSRRLDIRLDLLELQQILTTQRLNG